MPEDNPLIDALNQMKEPKTPGQALQHSQDSFPVLKAFQEYLEAERRKMRQRTMAVAAVAAFVSLAILVTLVVAGMFLLSGTNASQDRLLEAQYRMLDAVVGISQSQNRPIPAPVVPESVAKDFETRVSGELSRAVDGLTKLMESMRSEVKTTVAAEQTFESSKVYAVMLDVQEQLKGINDELNTLRAAPPAPAIAPQTRPAIETVSPVRPSSDFPDLAERWEQQNRQPEPRPGEVPAARVQPALNEAQTRPLGVSETRPLAVIDPAHPALPETTPRAATAIPPASPEKPLKVEFSNTPGRDAQPATLTLPAPDGSPAAWRLVVPAANP